MALAITSIERVVKEDKLAEFYCLLCNPEPDSSAAGQNASLMLYKCPTDKRAFIKDIRIAEYGAAGGAGWFQGGSSEITLTTPPSTTTKNQISLFDGRMLVVSAYADGADIPNAIYMPNFSGGVLPTVILKPEGILWMHWDFDGTNVAIANGILVQAVVHGVEVTL